MRPITWVWLAAGGIAGTFARYAMTLGVNRLAGPGFPFGTLAVNLLGCAVIGFLASLSATRWALGPDARLLLVTGFCGAFTTFSAFMLETTLLADSGQTWRAVAYVAASVGLGLAAFRAGAFLAARF